MNGPLFDIFRRCVSAAAIIFLIAPLAIVLIVSFSSAPYLTFPPPSLSLRWYIRLSQTEAWIDAAKTSLQVTPIAVLVSTVLGTSAAYGALQIKGIARALLTAVMLAPLVVPIIIVGIGMYGASVQLGLSPGVLLLVLAHTVLITPYSYITVSAALSAINPRLEAAAQTRGATRLAAFWHITVPLLLPAIVSGALFGFVISFDEVVVSSFLSKPGTRTVAVQMWSDVMGTTDPSIAALATLLFGLSLIVLALSRLARRSLAQSDI
jgi:putative spermidine/putrescine transport system permease protein